MEASEGPNRKTKKECIFNKRLLFGVSRWDDIHIYIYMYIYILIYIYVYVHKCFAAEGAMLGSLAFRSKESLTHMYEYTQTYNIYKYESL